MQYQMFLSTVAIRIWVILKEINSFVGHLLDRKNVDGTNEIYMIWTKGR